MNNQVIMIGQVADGYRFDHECHGERFYRFSLKIKRASDAVDVVPVMVSDKLIDTSEDITGQYMWVYGQFRSFNKKEGLRKKLMLYVFVSDLELISVEENENQVDIDGYLVKEPIHRTTPLGREITDMLIAVNRNNGKTDYIPCVSWGRSARYCSRFSVGDRVLVSGRFQSREYLKDDQTRTAYELSINQIVLA